MATEQMKSSRFYRLGAFAYRNRGRIVIAWILALALLAPQLGVMTSRMSSGGFEVPGSESDRVKQIIETRFDQQFDRSDLLVMYSDTHRPPIPSSAPSTKTWPRLSPKRQGSR